MNFSEFIDMAYNNITYQYHNQASMKVKLSVHIDDSLLKETISNFGVVSLDPVMIGIVIDHVGVLVCQFTDDDLLYPITDWTRLNPLIACNTANTSQLIPMNNALTIYTNQYDPSYFFITQSNPPGVVEVNIADSYNAYVFKQY